MYRVRLVGFTHKYSLLSPARRNISIILPSLSRRTIQGGNRLVRGASSSLLQIFFYEPCPHKIGLSLLAYLPFWSTKHGDIALNLRKLCLCTVRNWGFNSWRWVWFRYLKRSRKQAEDFNRLCWQPFLVFSLTS